MYSIVDLQILNSFDELTPELISVLQQEVMQHLSCNPAGDA